MFWSRLTRSRKSLEAFAARVAGFNVVPEFNVVLVLFPAQENLPPLAHRGKINQAAVEILDLNFAGARPSYVRSCSVGISVSFWW